MHIVVCTKEVLDPDAVNSYALWGRLKIGPDGRSFQATGEIARIINAYDEQAIEAALRIKEAGGDCTVTALAVGGEGAVAILRRCMAMGADGMVQVLDPQAGAADGFRSAALLAEAIRRLGNVDLVLCGRQGSDYDQGVVPAVLAERLGAAFVSMAMAVQRDGDGVRVTRVTPHGPEVVRAALPAVVSVSNELGTPRYPSSRGMMAARKATPVTHQASDLLGAGAATTVELSVLQIPELQGTCVMIEGNDPAAKARELMRRLREAGVIGG